VAKHADASRVAVRLAGGPDSVHLAITDDGVGFDAAAELGGTMGLSTMAERAAGVGGRVDVLSQVGAGTVVSFEWERSDA
jgi:signal transduction histidine kinase